MCGTGDATLAFNKNYNNVYYWTAMHNMYMYVLVFDQILDLL